MIDLNSLKEILPVIGSITAALIAGGIAFLAAVFTKESKISEFRQAWIDGLRNDIAEFVASYHYIAEDMEVVRNYEKNFDERQYFLSIKNEVIRFELSQARIELRLNPKEHRDFLLKVKNIGKMDQALINDHKNRKDAVNSLVLASQKVFSDEWKRVKRGELIFTVAKWISLFIFSLGVCLISSLAYLAKI